MKKKNILIGVISLFVMPLFLLAQNTPQPQDQANANNSGKVYNDGTIDYASSTVSFTIAGEDTLSAVKSIMYKIDNGEYAEYKSPITIKDEGEHIIYYYSIDNVGNKSPESSYKVYIDNTAPDVMLVPSVKLFKNGDNNYAPLSCEYTLLASDNGAGVSKIEYAIDNGQYQEYNAPIKLTEGSHTIKYRAIDNVGNVSKEKTLSVIVDNKAPDIKIIPSGKFFEKDGKNYAPQNFQYQIEATDTDSDVAKVLISIDNGNYVVYEGPITFNKEGEHTIKAKAIDNVGNTSNEVDLTFILDKTPPKVELNPAQK